MKKLLVVLLALVTVFVFAACGEQEEPAADEGFTAIPLGGDLGDFALAGDAYGDSYVEIDFPEGTDLTTVSEAHLYASEGSNTPYISVYRWANEAGNDLEAETASCAEFYGLEDYYFGPWEDIGQDEVGYMFSTYEDETGFYFVESDIIADGDEFVEIDFYSATEEVALGESGQYIYVPTGYTDLMAEDEYASEYDEIFYGKYGDGFELPKIWIGIYGDESYAYQEWWWYESFPDGLPVDEATYNELLAKVEKEDWTDELTKEYYDFFGCSFEELNSEELSEGIVTASYKVTYDDADLAEEFGDMIDLYFGINDVYYEIWLSYDAAVPFCNVLVDSLHTK